MKQNSAFNVQIWCSLRKGYNGPVQKIKKAQSICQNFVDNIKECVTITPTTFVYVGDNEPGFVVGFIRYPRYVNSKKEIQKRAIKLGMLLMKELGQNRVTITTPKKSIMLENKKVNQLNVKSKTTKK